VRSARRRKNNSLLILKEDVEPVTFLLYQILLESVKNALSFIPRSITIQNGKQKRRNKMCECKNMDKHISGECFVTVPKYYRDEHKDEVNRCPLCGISLNHLGLCPLGCSFPRKEKVQVFEGLNKGREGRRESRVEEKKAYNCLTCKTYPCKCKKASSSFAPVDHDEKLKQMQEIFDKCLEIANGKGHDYSGTKDAMSNFHDFGWKGIVVRLGDKFHRIKNFCKQEELLVKDESIEDTLLDIINYAALCLIEKRIEEKK